MAEDALRKRFILACLNKGQYTVQKQRCTSSPTTANNDGIGNKPACLLFFLCRTTHYKKLKWLSDSTHFFVCHAAAECRVDTKCSLTTWFIRDSAPRVLRAHAAWQGGPTGRHGVCAGSLVVHSMRRYKPLERLGAMRLQTTCLPPGGVNSMSKDQLGSRRERDSRAGS